MGSVSLVHEIVSGTNLHLDQTRPLMGKNGIGERSTEHLVLVESWSQASLGLK